MNIDTQGAREIVRAALQEEWARVHRPILGTHLKIKVSEIAQRAGFEFDEKSLGFPGFKELLSSCDFLALDVRSGTDILIVPSEKGELLRGTPTGRMKVKKEFWDAFLRFPRGDTLVGYDTATNTVIHFPPLLGSGIIPITPITKEEQLEWRRAFAAKEPPTSPLTNLDLGRDDAWEKFSHVIQRTVDVRKRWNAEKLALVTEAIRQWASANNVPESVWHEPLEAHNVAPDARRQLYRILDKIPIESLLALKIPLGWLVREKP